MTDSATTTSVLPQMEGELTAERLEPPPIKASIETRLLSCFGLLNGPPGDLDTVRAEFGLGKVTALTPDTVITTLLDAVRIMITDRRRGRAEHLESLNRIAGCGTFIEMQSLLCAEIAAIQPPDPARHALDNA